MKKFFTLLFSVLFTTASWAQINAGSPFPINFTIEEPASIAGSFDYGTQADDWGPILDRDVRGEVQWAYDATDSLACTAVVTDLTGKMALIRRGACNFSTKIWNAEQAGAIGVIIINHFDNVDDNDETVVGMAWGADMEPVTIPAVFISRSTGVILLSELDAGNTVTAAFDLTNMNANQAALAYQTPLSQAIPLNLISVSYFNDDSTKAVSPDVTATIVGPGGTVLAQNTVTAEVGPRGDSTFLFPEFMPTEIGDYEVVFTNSLTPDTLRSPFVMSDFTFCLLYTSPSPRDATLSRMPSSA